LQEIAAVGTAAGRLTRCSAQGEHPQVEGLREAFASALG
jgi:hypothetical protein